MLYFTAPWLFCILIPSPFFTPQPSCHLATISLFCVTMKESYDFKSAALARPLLAMTFEQRPRGGRQSHGYLWTIWRKGKGKEKEHLAQSLQMQSPWGRSASGMEARLAMRPETQQLREGERERGWGQGSRQEPNYSDPCRPSQWLTFSWSEMGPLKRSKQGNRWSDLYFNRVILAVVLKQSMEGKEGSKRPVTRLLP